MDLLEKRLQAFCANEVSRLKNLHQRYDIKTYENGMIVGALDAYKRIISQFKLQYLYEPKEGNNDI